MTSRLQHLGWVVRKPINTNPGLNVDRGFNFCCNKSVFIAYVLWRLRLADLKTGGQEVKTENLTEKLKN